MESWQRLHHEYSEDQATDFKSQRIENSESPDFPSIMRTLSDDQQPEHLYTCSDDYFRFHHEETCYDDLFRSQNGEDAFATPIPDLDEKLVDFWQN